MLNAPVSPLIPPRLDGRVKAAVPEAVVLEVERIAAETGATHSAVVRAAVEHGLRVLAGSIASRA